MKNNRKQSEQVFTGFYNNYYEKIYRFVAWRIANKHQSEDIVAEVFMKLFQMLLQNSEVSDDYVRNWLYLVAKNKCVDHFRKQSKRELVLSEEEGFLFVDDQSNPEDNQEKREQLQWLSKQLELLPEVQRESMLLKYTFGYKNKEIADMLGVDEKTVSSNLSRAKQKVMDGSLSSKHHK